MTHFSNCICRLRKKRLPLNIAIKARISFFAFTIKVAESLFKYTLPMFNWFCIKYNKGKSAKCKWIEKTDFPPVTTKEPSPSVNPINHSKTPLSNHLLSPLPPPIYFLMEINGREGSDRLEGRHRLLNPFESVNLFIPYWLIPCLWNFPPQGGSFVSSCKLEAAAGYIIPPRGEEFNLVTSQPKPILYCILGTIWGATIVLNDFIDFAAI
uniref:LAGLIDADG endonuclease n=1 Tax=Morchella brunnea TaxID=1174671 RepID=A0A8K1I802_9PEZI|nr:LAGLIDADG endonuclease [Morchella brunnea]UBU98593.1 LAGLIDADG endonuclease [Morchella brunnea]